MKETKILREHHQKIHYSEDHWNLLRKKRKDAKELLQLFSKTGLKAYLFGSIARGDVHENS